MLGSEQQQILRWLNIPDILTTHHRQTAAKHQGTGDWIFKHSAYEAWKADTSKILWIHGIRMSARHLSVPDLSQTNTVSWMRKICLSVKYLFVRTNVQN